MRQLIAGIGLLFCFSCGTDTSEIGVSFFQEGSLDISYIDTASVSLSTIRYDRIATNSTSRILVGTSNDTKLGRISAAAFVQLNAASGDLEEADASFDYLALHLKYDDYFYYDTTAVLTLKVHQVGVTIEANDEGYIDNKTNFSFYANTLGSLSFKPHPNRDDSVEVKLSDDLGLEFFQKLKQGNEVFTSSSDFTKYFKGVAIVPDTSISSSILAFTAASEVRLYYWDKSVVPAQHKYISFAASGIYSTKISTNQIHEALASLSEQREKVSAAYTNDEAYIQGGTGLALRVDMPYLRELKQLENFYVTRAQLEIYVVRKSYDGNTLLPTSITPYYVDGSNETLLELSTDATLVEDTDLGRHTRYVLDVTSIVKNQMELQEFNQNALLFNLDSQSKIVNRICFASPGYDYKTHLRIYYATVNTN